MKACESYIMLMNQCMDGEATQEEAANLHAHLAECEACRTLYDFYTAMDQAIRDNIEEPPEQLTAAIMNGIRKEKKQNQPKQLFRRYRFTAMAAVAAVIVLVAAKVGGDFSFRATTSSSAQVERFGADAAPQVAAEFRSADMAGNGTMEATAETVETALPAEVEMSVEGQKSGDTSAMVTDEAGAVAEMPAPESSAIFSDAQITSMEEAGFCGIAVRTGDIDAVELWLLFPGAQQINLSTGETVYQVEADLVQAAVDAGKLQFFATYEPIITEPDPIYWIFLDD